MVIHVKTAEGQDFELEREIAEKSVLLKNMLEDIGESEEAIPLPNVTSQVLEKIIAWCDHHKNDVVVNEDDERKVKDSEDIDEWDRKFCDVDKSFLFEIILAANYLDIKPLLDLGCKTVANLIKGKSPQQIREIFDLENDFTPEEEERIRQENAWAEDI